MHKVSICIPAYKQTEFLAKTLNSIKIQNFKDFEIIITDDSPDDSVEQLINTYDFDGKLKYIKNKIPKGSPANWNEAIQQASGEYIKIMHHDDWFTDEDSLSKFVRLLDDNPDADFAFSGCFNFYGSNKTHHFVSSEDVIKIRTDPFNLLLGNLIGAPSVVIHRSSISTRYDENIKWLVDLDFYIRVIVNSNFVWTEEALTSICSDGSHQVTKECVNNVEIEIPEYIYVYNKYINQNQLSINAHHKKYLTNLFCRSGIISIERLRKLPLISPIPQDIESLFGSWQKIRLRLIYLTINIYKRFFPKQLRKIITVYLRK